jgi:hypothetical protein
MGLYLCVFEVDVEIEGVEIGLYADFNFFKDVVVAYAEGGNRGSRCPTLTMHHDSDGAWSPAEARLLLEELTYIESILGEHEPIELNSQWKREIAQSMCISPQSLLACFYDVDGEPLVERLKGLAAISIQHDVPILFQ